MDKVGSKLIIVGLFRSGTSCVAGIATQLGYNMGEPWCGPRRWNKKGVFEDRYFAQVCRMSFQEPGMRKKMSDRNIKAMLRCVFSRRNSDGPQGIKHPTACLMAEPLLHVFPEAKYLFVKRPLEHVIESRKRARWPVFPKALEMMEYCREGFYDQTPTDQRMAINYYSLLDDPLGTVGDISSWLGLPPVSPDHSAVRFVEPRLCHNR